MYSAMWTVKVADAVKLIWYILRAYNEFQNFCKFWLNNVQELYQSSTMNKPSEYKAFKNK